MSLFNILLYIHIFTGGVSLLLGLFVLIAKKGDKTHKKIVNIYFLLMLCNGITAIPMSYLHPNLFLFLITVWTLFMLITGKRYLRIKSVNNVSKYDWTIHILSSLAAAIFLFIGIKLLLRQNTFGIVVLVFASIMTLMIIQDYLNYKGKSKTKNYWLTTHIQRMVASYIATTTAFLVVNNTVLPDVLAWLLPTILLTPLLIYWARKWEVKV